MNGIISYFDSHKPSDKELENYWYVDVTLDIPQNPYHPSFAEQDKPVCATVSTDYALLVNEFVFPVHAELFNDDKLVDWLVSKDNVPADDWNGDGMGTYFDEDLYDADDIGCQVSQIWIISLTSVCIWSSQM